MLRKMIELRAQKGSLMIEALAMLGLISMVTPVIYKKAAERTTEMQDINAASEVRVVVKAIDDYLRDNYTTITAGESVTTNASTVNYSEFKSAGTQSKTVNISDFTDYLPIGFRADGRTFRDFKVAIKKTESGERKGLTTVLLTVPGSGAVNMSKLRSSRIASMIGTNGGYIEGNLAKGVQGVWEVPVAQFVPGENPSDGTIVATSIQAVADGTAGGKNVLHRVEVPGQPELNTMDTTLYMGNNDLKGLNNLIAYGDDLVLKNGDDNGNLTLTVEGGADIESDLKAALNAAGDKFLFEVNQDFARYEGDIYAGGEGAGDTHVKLEGDTGNIYSTVNGEDKFKVEDGDVTMTGNLNVGGNATIEGQTHSKGDLLVGPLPQFRVQASTGNTGTVGSMAIKGETKIGNTLSVGDLAQTNPNPQDGTISNKIFEVKKDGNVGQTSATQFRAGSTNVSTDNFYALEVSVDKSADTRDVDVNLKNSLSWFRVNGSVNLGGTGKEIMRVSDEGTKVRLKRDDASFEVFSTGENQLIYADSDLVQMQADGTGINPYISAEPDGAYIGRDIGGTDTVGVSYNVHPKNSNLSAFNVHDNAEFKVWKGIGDNARGVFQVDNRGEYTGDVYNPNNKGKASVYVNHGIIEVGDTTNGGAPVFQVAQDNPAANKGSVHVRKGIIEIATNSGGASNPNGYIRADRLLSNSNFVNKDKTTVLGTTGDGTGNQYDEYQVNPAYTSMMHDIKLTSRGGARLSDILPDFINKGIYVMDNTYKGDSDWTASGATISNLDRDVVGQVTSTGIAVLDRVLNGLTSCGEDRSCETSPWLGFIPTPQCPPGYVRVATINPIRFKVAEAGIPIKTYEPGTTNDHGGNYRLIVPRTDPRGDTDASGNYMSDGMTKVKIYSDSSESSGYRAEVYSSPLTFQVNTWLNTALKAYGDGTNFKGWSGVMGFIYPALDYVDYAQGIGAESGTPSSNDVYWNLFPVYNRELSSISTVYCYFDRKDAAFDANLVDKYLSHNNAIRTSNSGKTGTYEGRLNDPTLKYNTIW